MSKIANLSSNALLAKSRAMYSTILTREDYNQLINCHTINELVNYLKSNTIYSDALITSSGVELSRARMEARINQFNYKRISDLAAFENAIGQNLNQIIYLEFDITIILNCAEHLDSNTISDFSLLFQTYSQHSQLDFIELEKANNFEELYNALKGTPYQQTLEMFVNGSSVYNTQLLENSLHKFLCDEIKNIISKNYKGNDKKELLDIFLMRSDFKMFESIYRIKKYFQNNITDLNKFFYAGFSALSEKEIQQLINAKDTEDLFSLINKTKYGKYFDENITYSIEKSTSIAKQKINQKKLRFSTLPEVVLFSYIGLIENEAKNIIHIIECVRYGLPPEEIEKHLVIN